MKKIIRVATHSGSLGNLLQGQLHFMSKYYEVIGVGSPGEKIENYTSLEKLMHNESVRGIPLEISRQIEPFKDLKSLWGLYKIFKRERPDIVHSHTPKAGTLAMIAAKLARVPHRLHTIAGLPLVEVTGKKRQLLNVVEKITYHCATKIYPNSYGLKEIILQNKFTTSSKLKVLGNGSSNGIDLNYFNPDNITQVQKQDLRVNLGIAKEDFVFVFLGRLVKDKGINELISAFKNLNNRMQNTKLLLLGAYEKELDPLLPITTEEIQNNQNIITAGWVSDVRPYLAISNALVFPSYREGFPNTVMQACAMKLPCIVSNINGCNEIIKNNINGLVIPVKDQISLVQAMEKFRANKDFLEKLAKNTRQLIQEKYERTFVWNEILKEYKLLIDV